jgi:hypothetical protein
LFWEEKKKPPSERMWFDGPQLVVEGVVDVSISQEVKLAAAHPAASCEVFIKNQPYRGAPPTMPKIRMMIQQFLSELLWAKVAHQQFFIFHRRILIT